VRSYPVYLPRPIIVDQDTDSNLSISVATAPLKCCVVLCCLGCSPNRAHCASAYIILTKNVIGLRSYE
jgi:hypothetical protein